jgi:hypothetical protein
VGIGGGVVVVVRWWCCIVVHFFPIGRCMLVTMGRRVNSSSVSVRGVAFGSTRSSVLSRKLHLDHVL